VAKERFVRLMQRDALPRLFGSLDGHFDVVLVDGPPLCETSPAVRLLPHVGRVILVENSGSRLASLQEAVRRMGLFGTTALGFVFNHAPRHRRERPHVRPAVTPARPARAVVESPATPRA
jgi:Mrp family chromosome partitioning ATPase